MDITILPDGLFRTLVGLWMVFRNTYVRIYEWMGSFGFGEQGTVLSCLIGVGIFVILGVKVGKFVKDLLPRFLSWF